MDNSLGLTTSILMPMVIKQTYRCDGHISTCFWPCCVILNSTSTLLLKMEDGCSEIAALWLYTGAVAYFQESITVFWLFFFFLSRSTMRSWNLRVEVLRHQVSLSRSRACILLVLFQNSRVQYFVAIVLGGAFSFKNEWYINSLVIQQINNLVNECGLFLFIYLSVVWNLLPILYL